MCEFMTCELSCLIQEATQIKPRDRCRLNSQPGDPRCFAMFCQDFLLTVQSSRSCRSYHLAGLPGDDGLSQAMDLPVTAVSDGTICQTTARPPRVPWQGYRCWLRVLTFWEQRFDDVLGNLGTVLPGFWEEIGGMVPEYCLNCSFLLGLCSQPGGVDQIDG